MTKLNPNVPLMQLAVGMVMEFAEMRDVGPKPWGGGGREALM
jgi:hypothetical protein